MINDIVLIQVNVIKIAISFAYMFIFFHYTNNIKDRHLAWSQVAYGGAFMAVVFAYTHFENPNVLKFRYGLISTSLLLFFISFEFLKLVSKL